MEAGKLEETCGRSEGRKEGRSGGGGERVRRLLGEKLEGGNSDLILIQREIIKSKTTAESQF